MTAPSPPFATSAAVAYLLQTFLQMGTDFDEVETTPRKSTVEQHITWVSAQVEMQFQMAGYVVPLATVSGETWPSSQTTYLQLVTSFGAAALSGGHSLRPAPALGPGQPGSSGNIFQDMFQQELRKIFTPPVGIGGVGKTFLKFRAQYYAGTPAEEAISLPKGPTTDFWEGHYDPMRQLSNWDIADKVLAIQQSMTDLEISWDYLYSLFDLQKGFATSIYEL